MNNARSPHPLETIAIDSRHRCECIGTPWCTHAPAPEKCGQPAAVFVTMFGLTASLCPQCLILIAGFLQPSAVAAGFSKPTR